MDQALLLAYSAQHIHTSSSVVRLIQSHISLDPNPLLQKLFMELCLIYIDNMLISSHKLSYLHYCPLLFLRYLFLLCSLAAVGVLWLSVGHFVLLIDHRQDQYGDLDVELLLDQSDSSVQGKVGPLGQSLRVDQVLDDLGRLPLRAWFLPETTVDYAEAVHFPANDNAHA